MDVCRGNNCLLQLDLTGGPITCVLEKRTCLAAFQIARVNHGAGRALGASQEEAADLQLHQNGTYLAKYVGYVGQQGQGTRVGRGGCIAQQKRDVEITQLANSMSNWECPRVISPGVSGECDKSNKSTMLSDKLACGKNIRHLGYSPMTYAFQSHFVNPEP